MPALRMTESTFFSPSKLTRWPSMIMVPFAMALVLLFNGVDRAERAGAPAGTAVDALARVDRMRHADLAGDRLHRAVLLALTAAAAQLGIDLQMASASVAVRAVLIHNVRKILVAEIFQRGEHRLARALSQTAQRRLRDSVCKLLEHIEILKRAFVGDDALQDLQHALCALAAGDALAAAFILREVHEEARRLDHAGVLVHDDETAGADDRADLLERVEVKRHIEVLLRQAAAGRTADLHGLELLAVLDAAANIENDLAQRRPHRDLHKTGVDHIARKRKGFRAG